MLKVIYFDYGYSSTIKEKMQKIKAAGFDGVFLFGDETFDEAYKEAKNLGLYIETIHLPFRDICNTLWESGSIGDDYVNEMIKWIKIAHEHNIDKVIFHTSQKPKPEPSQIGLDRFKKIVKAAEEYQVYLAVENLRHLDLMDICLEATSSPYVVACFDSGHANAFTCNINEYDFAKYQGKIKCLHLHDNDGTKDAHLPIFSGNIDFKKLMRELKEINYNGCLTLELLDKVQIVPEDTYLEQAYKSLVLLDKYYNEK